MSEDALEYIIRKAIEKKTIDEICISIANDVSLSPELKTSLIQTIRICSDAKDLYEILCIILR